MNNKRCILIVEDEPLIAMMLEDFIESLGHEVRGPCESVTEALAMVEADGFDLAILDVNLKGESVWPVATALRAKGIPFVLASGGQWIATSRSPDGPLNCRRFAPLGSGPAGPTA